MLSLLIGMKIIKWLTQERDDALLAIEKSKNKATVFEKLIADTGLDNFFN